MTNNYQRRVVLGERITSLECLRVFGFIGVILNHTYIIDLGAWGVSIFFMLTGFLLTYRYWDKEMPLSIKSMIGFSYKHIMKLYPLYLCTLIVIVPISGWKFEIENFNNLFIHIFLLQSLFEREIMVLYNGPAWYLSCMMFIYLAMPIIINFVKKYKSKAEPIAVSFILFGLQIVIDIFTPVYSYAFPLTRLIDVVIGCNLGWLFINKKDIVDNEFKYTLYEIFAIAFVVVSEVLFLKILKPYHEIFIPSSMFIVYIFAMNRGKITKMLTNDFFVHLGSISSYIFLIHIVVQCYVDVVERFIIHKEVSNVVLFIITLVISIVCSEIWKIYESKKSIKYTL